MKNALLGTGWRHMFFKKPIMTRHALYYTMIIDPFTDD